ncbi:MAG TPA: DUF2750 domain-containing protein [Verrucomicrobiae bacterium]
MKITEAQLKAVTALAGPKRYSHFIKVVADQALLWGLYADGWALAATGEGQQVFPFWPGREYAQLCATGPWTEYQPEEIDLDDFLQELLPDLKEKNIAIGVFYTPTDKGIIPAFEELENDLRNELSRIEE